MVIGTGDCLHSSTGSLFGKLCHTPVHNKCNRCEVATQDFTVDIKPETGFEVDTALCTLCAHHLHHWNLSNGASE